MDGRAVAGGGGSTMKSGTDLHWAERARSVENDHDVNIMDVFQRELEYEHVIRQLGPEDRVLEVGCGNGFSTARFRPLVRHVDAFDFSEEMIRRAKSAYGETNNRFLHDNVLEPRGLEGPYDVALCIRVLINLRDLAEQARAVRNLASVLRPGGRLVLVEGFRDGFERLSELRAEVGLPPVEPARINFYSSLGELLPEIEAHFERLEEFHLGAYDYLTRVFYPLLVGPDAVRHNSVYCEKAHLLARAFNPAALGPFSRIQGMVLRRK